MFCKTCHKEYDGESWKTQCYECYKNFKGKPRIFELSRRKGFIILTHPDVKKEEVDKWIEKNYGSVNTPENWGAEECTGKLKVWFNCTNTD